MAGIYTIGYGSLLLLAMGMGAAATAIRRLVHHTPGTKADRTVGGRGPTMKKAA